MSKTTDQTPLDEAANALDVLDIVDVSDDSDGVAGSSKQITVGHLLLAAGIKVVKGFEGYVIIAASGNTDPKIVQENDVLIGKGAYHEGNYVMMRALQDSPNDDEHFKKGLNNGEAI